MPLPFGQTLYLWRCARGLTQGELAKRAKVSRPNLSAIERGKREVSLSTLRMLAAALGVRPGILVDGIPPQTAEGAAPSLSRETIERLANAVAFGGRVANSAEQAVVEALRTLLRHRTHALRRQRGRPRTGPRAAIGAWLTLNSLYSKEAIQMLADRVAERQHAHDAADH